MPINKALYVYLYLLALFYHSIRKGLRLRRPFTIFLIIRKFQFLMNDYITNIATVRITTEDNIIIKIQLRTHFNQVLYSTLAIDRPPITTPEVGVNRLITPEAAEKIITITAGLKPI